MLFIVFESSFEHRKSTLVFWRYNVWYVYCDWSESFGWNSIVLKWMKLLLSFIIEISTIKLSLCALNLILPFILRFVILIDLFFVLCYWYFSCQMIILPFIPILALLVQTSVSLNDLLKSQADSQDTETQVSEIYWAGRAQYCAHNPLIRDF